MSAIEGRIRTKLGDQVKPTAVKKAKARQAGSATAAQGMQSLDKARERMIQGTVLLFDKQLIRAPGDSAAPGQMSKRQRPDWFSLAFVESQVKTDAEATEDPWFTYKKPGLRGILVPLSEEVRQKMRRHAVDRLAAAMKANADAVVFPEFALPPVDLSGSFPQVRSFNPFNPDHQEVVDRHFEEAAASILADACQAASRNPQAAPFIFYGSMHCQRSRFNIGVVSPGHPLEQRYVLATERSNPITNKTRSVVEGGVRKGPLVHKKRFPARRIGEAARVPGGLGFRLYPSKIGFIAVMICSDAIDLNQFWYIVQHNQRADRMAPHDRVALVIVPAYTHSDLLHSTCKDLSALARTAVFVGNCTGTIARENSVFEKSMPPSAFFQGGLGVIELERNFRSNQRDGVCYYRFRPKSSPH